VAAGEGAGRRPLPPPQPDHRRPRPRHPRRRDAGHGRRVDYRDDGAGAEPGGVGGAGPAVLRDGGDEPAHPAQLRRPRDGRGRRAGRPGGRPRPGAPRRRIARGGPGGGPQPHRGAALRRPRPRARPPRRPLRRHRPRRADGARVPAQPRVPRPRPPARRQAVLPRVAARLLGSRGRAGAYPTAALPRPPGVPRRPGRPHRARRRLRRWHAAPDHALAVLVDPAVRLLAHPRGRGRGEAGPWAPGRGVAGGPVNGSEHRVSGPSGHREGAADSPISETLVEIVVPPGQEPGVRLDHYLTSKLPNVTRSKVQRGIREGRVTVNDAPQTKPSYPVQPGDRIVCRILRPPPLEVVPEPIPLDVVYEDGWLLVVNKPAGMVVHPAYGHRSGTLVNALLHHVGAGPVTAEDLGDDEG